MGGCNMYPVFNNKGGAFVYQWLNLACFVAVETGENKIQKNDDVIRIAGIRNARILSFFNVQCNKALFELFFVMFRNLTLASLSLVFTIKIHVFALFYRF